MNIQESNRESRLLKSMSRKRRFPEQPRKRSDAFQWWFWGIPLLFIYIFAPSSSHMPFGFVKLVSAFAWVMIFVKYRDDFVRFLREPLVMWGLFGVMLSLAYILVVGVPQPQRYRFPYRVVLFFVEVLPISYVGARLLVSKHSNPIEVLLLLIYIVGFAQGMLAGLLFLMPDVNLYVQQSVLGFDPVDKIFALTDRGFGIGSGYLFSLPLFQGLAVCCGIHLAILYRKWWLILGIPVILVAVVLNARIGLIIPFVYCSTIAAAAFFRADFTVLVRLIVLLIGVTIIGALSLALIKLADLQNVGNVIDWVGSAFLEVLERDDFYGRSTVDTLLSMIFFPPNILFGAGIYIFQNPAAPAASDIGYVIHLYYGGAALITVLYLSFMPFFLMALRVSRNWYTKILIPVLLFCLAAGNFKGDVLSSNDITRVAFLILTVVIVAFLEGRERAQRQDRPAPSSRLRSAM